MKKSKSSEFMWKTSIIVVMLMTIMGLYLINFKNSINSIYIDKAIVQNFSTVFLSIIFEALPFIMLGAFISALIQVFISEQTIAKLIPKNKFVGLLIASLMGFVFPVCECAIVPIARRLIKKGVPVSIVVTFMLAVPIVNPVVLTSTYYAFYGKPVMVLIRGGCGLAAAILIGFLIDWLEEDKNPMKFTTNTLNHQENEHECSCGCGHVHHEHENPKSKIVDIIEHTSAELYDIGKYLIFGAVISSIFQVFISRGYILSAGRSNGYSVLVMMLFAYVISLCSEADAFIARSFLNQFTMGSIAAFLILGPMIDIKNTLMLGAAFKKKFVIELICLIFSVCFIIGTLINRIGL